MPDRRILIVASTTGYQTRRFAEVARAIGLQPVLATDRCHQLEDPWRDQALPVRFEQPEEAARALAATGQFSAIVAVGDRPAYLAACVAEQLGLPFHPPQAMAAARNKYLARKRFHAAGLLVPAYFRVSASADPSAVARQSSYPCVLKPLGLSGSRGVIRADTETGFIAAFERIRAILAQPEIRRERDPANDFIHVESYIPGRELALEGIVTAGRLRMLALFDKPDPLDGPFFEETIYVTPSREPPCSQREILDTVRRAVEALGFRHGPVHAEIRVNSQGVWILEAAGRPIGGLCAQALRFEHDRGLEELILRHSLGEDIEPLRPARPASGVMMIPIPQPGVYHAARGEDRAAAIAGIDEVVITAKLGQKLVPLPEGQSYLGFIFASGHTPADVEASLRAAHAELEFDLAGVLPVIR